MQISAIRVYFFLIINNYKLETNHKKFGLIGKDISYTFTKKYYTEKISNTITEESE